MVHFLLLQLLLLNVFSDGSQEQVLNDDPISLTHSDGRGI